MKTEVNTILKRISVLFYIFAGLFVLSFILGIIFTIVEVVSSDSISIASQGGGIHTEKNMATTVWNFVEMSTLIALVVIFIRVLICMWKAIRSRNVFSLKIVDRIKEYAIVYTLYIVTIFVGNLIRGFDGSCVSLSDLTSQMIKEFSTIVMLLIFGQVIRIGYILKQEQELTI